MNAFAGNLFGCGPAGGRYDRCLSGVNGVGSVAPCSSGRLVVKSSGNLVLLGGSARDFRVMGRRCSSEDVISGSAFYVSHSGRKTF